LPRYNLVKSQKPRRRSKNAMQNHLACPKDNVKGNRKS